MLRTLYSNGIKRIGAYITQAIVQENTVRFLQFYTKNQIIQ